MEPVSASSDPTAAVEQLLELLRSRSSFLVTSHARPDGDAIGSALGLMHLLEAMGKQATVALADPIPVIYQSLPGVERIVAQPPPGRVDAAVLLECDSVERSGFAALDAAFTINIDHHRSGQRFANWNWIDPDACAVGEMLYQLATASGLPISPAAATCLYTAVLTDTGSFTYSCTTAGTFDLASHLIACGVDAHAVAEAVYFSNPVGKVRILGAALQRMKVDGPLAWTSITQQDMDEAGAIAADCEGVVNYLIGIAGVQAAAVLREMPAPAAAAGDPSPVPETARRAARPGYRASLRSKDGVDVAAAAERFGGGGHDNASGCTLPGPLPEALSNVLRALRDAVQAAAQA